MGGQDQVTAIRSLFYPIFRWSGRGGIETGMGSYLPEGHLTHYEYDDLPRRCPRRGSSTRTISLTACTHQGSSTINRFREASRIVDVGHQRCTMRSRAAATGHDRDRNRGWPLTPCAKRAANGNGRSQAATRSPRVSHRTGGRRVHPASRKSLQPGESSWWTCTPCSSWGWATIRTITCSARPRRADAGTPTTFARW